MIPINRTDNEARSADVIAQNIEVLKGLFPEAVSEGKLDLSVLKVLIGTALLPDEERDEKYGLNWFGKRKARQIALTPSTGTLRPCKEDSVDWDTTMNLMIEGDNLEVLKLLQKSYAGRVKLIYIDPPYNTGKDFVYPDNFQDNIKNYLELTGQIEGGSKMQANTEASGRFHTDWLNMMYPRIKLARNLLANDGVIFISIDDNEVSNLRKMGDEIFGEENFLANIVWQKKQSPQRDATYFSDMHDHIITYAKMARTTKADETGFLINLIERNEEQTGRYKNPDNDPRGDWASVDCTVNKTADERPNLFYPVVNPTTLEQVWPSKKRTWAFEKSKMEELLRDKRIWWGENGDNFPRVKAFISEVQNGVVPSTIWLREDHGDNQESSREISDLFPDEYGIFDTPKPTRLIKKMLEIATRNPQMGKTKEPEIVLDFFAGSGTTGHAVFSQNAKDGGERAFILVQLPEPTGRTDFPTLASVTAERLRRAGEKVRNENPLFKGDTGFKLFKLDTSNILPWEPEWGKLEEIVKKSVDHIKEGRSESDILYELLLKLGLDLAVPIEQKSIGTKRVYSIGAGTLIVCLDKKISRSDAEPLALGIVGWHKELAPVGETTCVFLDSGFADDVAKTNLSAILNQHGLANVRSL
jgi:adenine-specific DNA-methyltransferase